MPSFLDSPCDIRISFGPFSFLKSLGNYSIGGAGRTLIEIYSLTQEAVPDTIMRGEKQITKQWQSCVCSGISPLERERHGKRERKGGRGKGEGNYNGRVYTYGVFVCSRTAMGLEGDSPDCPQGGAALHSPALSHSLQLVHYMFTTGRNGLCADSSQKRGTLKVSPVHVWLHCSATEKRFPGNSHVPPTLGAPRSLQSAPCSISLA